MQNRDNLAALLEEFKTTAETRALIVLNGMGRTPPTEQDFILASLIAGTRDPHVGAADDADWRIFMLNTASETVFCPAWLVDTVSLLDPENVDTIIGQTPVRNWITGLKDIAELVPSRFFREQTVAMCDDIEKAGIYISDEQATRVQTALAAKFERITTDKEKAAIAASSPEAREYPEVSIVNRPTKQHAETVPEPTKEEPQFEPQPTSRPTPRPTPQFDPQEQAVS